MKRGAIFLSLSAAAMLTVAGCGRTIIRETVVEKPTTPAVKETVVEPPVVRETIVQQTPSACSVAGTTFSQGSASCQGGQEYRCNAGAWEWTGRYC